MFSTTEDCVCRAFEAPFFPPYSSCFSVMNWLPDKTHAEGGTHPLKESLAGLASTHALWLRHSNAITSALCALKQGYRGGQASFREDRAYRRLVPSIVSRGYKNARGGILFVARPPSVIAYMGSWCIGLDGGLYVFKRRHRWQAGEITMFGVNFWHVG